MPAAGICLSLTRHTSKGHVTSLLETKQLLFGASQTLPFLDDNQQVSPVEPSQCQTGGGTIKIWTPGSKLARAGSLATAPRQLLLDPSCNQPAASRQATSLPQLEKPPEHEAGLLTRKISRPHVTRPKFQEYICAVSITPEFLLSLQATYFANFRIQNEQLDFGVVVQSRTQF